MFSELGISTTFFDHFHNIMDFGSRDKRAKKKKKKTNRNFAEFHTIFGIQIEAAKFETVVDKQKK